MMAESCPTCDETFETSARVSAHHWQAHGEKLNYETVACDNCGEEIERHSSGIYERNFCGTECQYEYQSGETSPLSDRLTVECEWCGEEFTQPRHKIERSESNYCSSGCYGKAREQVTGVDHPSWSREIVNCHHCGDEFYAKPSKIEQNDRLFCSHDCLDTWRAVERSPDSLLLAVRNSLSDESWTSVARRYKADRPLRCEFCGAEGEGKRYDTHHIIPVLDGGVNEEELLMLLCRSCHITVEKYTENMLNRVITANWVTCPACGVDCPADSDSCFNCGSVFREVSA